MPSSQSGRAEPFGSAQDRLARLIARPFAHRGLHGGGRIENSRAAFLAAIAAGHGIELDVQASADGVAMVFHDEALDRLTWRSGTLSALAAAELERVPLRDSSETIPSLAEALALIAGRTPLLIEAKAPGRRAAALGRSVAAALTGYGGAVAVMSFNPEIGHWFARHDPERLRGLVVTESGRRWRGWLARPLALWRSRAHFLAYDVRDLPSSFAAAQRARGMKILTWTCRGAADRARAARHADQIIYEAES